MCMGDGDSHIQIFSWSGRHRGAGAACHCAGTLGIPELSRGHEPSLCAAGGLATGSCEQVLGSRWGAVLWTPLPSCILPLPVGPGKKTLRFQMLFLAMHLPLVKWSLGFCHHLGLPKPLQGS